MVSDKEVVIHIIDLIEKLDKKMDLVKELAKVNNDFCNLNSEKIKELCERIKALERGIG